MKSSHLLLCCSVIVISIVLFRYYEYVTRKDFLVYTYVSCNPEVEACFVPTCSPEEDPLCDLSPYKKITIPAYNAAACLYEHTCINFSCTKEDECVQTYCSTEEENDDEICLLNL